MQSNCKGEEAYRKVDWGKLKKKDELKNRRFKDTNDTKDQLL